MSRFGSALHNSVSWTWTPDPCAASCTPTRRALSAAVSSATPSNCANYALICGLGEPRPGVGASRLSSLDLRAGFLLAVPPSTDGAAPVALRVPTLKLFPAGGFFLAHTMKVRCGYYSFDQGSLSSPLLSSPFISVSGSSPSPHNPCRRPPHPPATGVTMGGQLRRKV